MKRDKKPAMRVIYYASNPNKTYTLTPINEEEEEEEEREGKKQDEEGVMMTDHAYISSVEAFSPFSGGSNADRIRHIREIYLP